MPQDHKGNQQDNNARLILHETKRRTKGKNVKTRVGIDFFKASVWSAIMASILSFWPQNAHVFTRNVCLCYTTFKLEPSAWLSGSPLNLVCNDVPIFAARRHKRYQLNLRVHANNKQRVHPPVYVPEASALGDKRKSNDAFKFEKKANSLNEPPIFDSSAGLTAIVHHVPVYKCKVDALTLF